MLNHDAPFTQLLDDATIAQSVYGDGSADVITKVEAGRNVVVLTLFDELSAVALTLQPPKGGEGTLRVASVDVTTAPNASLKLDLQRTIIAAIAIAGEENFNSLLLAQLAFDAMAALQDTRVMDALVARSDGAATCGPGVDDAMAPLAAHLSVYSTPVQTCRKSRFVGHAAAVASESEVASVLAHLRTRRSLAAATHPAIFAYRFADASGVIHSDFDDDGEAGAAKRLLLMLQQRKVDGVLIVVTRWFGGILLGPDRFKIITEVARDALVVAGRLPVS